MKFNLVEEKNVPVLGRKEYFLDVDFDGATPKTEDIKTGVAKQLKSDANLTVVKRIDNSYGDRSAKLQIYVYNNEEARKSIEEIQKYKVLKAKRDEELKKHKEGKEGAKKPAEEKAEAPKEEKPVEEVKKEEKKEEVVAKEEVKEEVKQESKDGKEESKE